MVEKQTTIKINGSDKQRVGVVASKIKSFRPPEPYKGKGIKVKGEYVLRKEGKKKVEMKLDKVIKKKIRNRNKLKRVNIKNRLRLTVNRSSKNISAQIIDDVKSKTLVAASSVEKDLKNSKKLKKSELSLIVGETLAKRANKANITKVYFDRGSYKYHGRVKLLADTLRKNGLQF